MNPVRPETLPANAHLVTLGETQPQYRTLYGTVTEDGTLTTDWEPTPEEVRAIKAGDRVRLTTLTFGHPFQPVLLTTAPASKEAVDAPVLDTAEVENDARILCDSYNGEDGTYDNYNSDSHRARWREAAVAAYRARMVRARL